MFVTIIPAIPARRWGAAFFLSMLTLAYSLFVAFHVTGNPMGTVKVTQLLAYGGTSFGSLADMEIWRLATSQLVHAKQLHMLLNVAGLYFLGSLLEARIGAACLFAIWLIAGGVATAVSPLGVESPWNVGTGASQATFAFATAALVIAVTQKQARVGLLGLSAFILLPGLTLDLMAAGYPKPGHLMAMLLGAVFGLAFSANNSNANTDHAPAQKQL
ncbi:rhomboid family intramembrane serine protease [Rhizobium sp. FY34]|uniref:rhomboid family intramembrane serine protease n=1 Tax=Rhizobium sp. FY34 TaxID=2562309 RepID=UPI0010C14936|nr:rhomboid family intramembrane serine protease [Rhizobium sp. FY34]